MNKQDKPKEYTIKSLNDIANYINVTNIDNFIEGFGDQLRQYVATIAITKEALRLKGDNKEYKNTDLIKFYEIKYIDDGKQENEVNIIKSTKK